MNYVDKQEMHSEIEYYFDTGVICDSLALKFVMLSVKIKDSTYFLPYEIDGMVETGIEHCIRYIDSYKLEHPAKNPFHFFSQRIKWAYLQQIRKDDRYKNFKSHVDNVTDYINYAYQQAS